jgi:hypothetical protein
MVRSWINLPALAAYAVERKKPISPECHLVVTVLILGPV